MHNEYYFGCYREPGHYLYEPGMRNPRGRDNDLPRALTPMGGLDGGFPPHERSGQPEGAAALHHVEGWTVLAFWDRSGDSRSGSNSAFLIRGTHDFDAMVERSRAAFPEVWARFTFEVRPQAGAPVS